MFKAYKYRLYPNKEQQVLIHKHFGASRYIYNWALNTNIKLFEEEGKSLNRFKLQKFLPVMKKKEETEWLKEINSQTLQATLINVDCAYKKFFREKKGFPKFKSKHDSNQSFNIPVSTTTRVDFEKKLVSVPKIKNIKFDAHREFPYEIKSCSVSRSASGKYFISFLVDDGKVKPNKPKVKEETTMGIDLGIKDFAILSDGKKIENPKYLKNKIKALKRSQRNLSRKKKGSANRDKAKLKLAKIHEKVSNARRDYQHKVSTSLVRDSKTDTFVMEDLSIKSMLKSNKKKLNQSINDASWFQFIEMMRYKCDGYGKNLIQIGRFEPSSKMCNNCGHLKQDLTLSDRVWTCSNCGTTHDRDLNAAKNIKRIGLGQPKFMPVEGEQVLSTKQETTKSLV